MIHPVVTFVADPVRNGVTVIKWKHVAVVTTKAEDGRHVGTKLSDIQTTSTGAIKEPVTADVFTTAIIAFNIIRLLGSILYLYG